MTSSEKKGAAAAVALLIVLIVGGWGFKVLTSDIKGQGDAIVTKNSAGNRIAAQEGFHKRYQDILATDRKLDLLAEQARSGDKTAQQTYVGVRSYCESVVGDYNAKARAYTAQDFRDADLPAQIDPLDHATDCKEN